MAFPGNKRFAFTIFDDTDLATVENVGPVYALLARLGMRTTKSVWALAPTQPSRIGGSTLAEPPYLDFVLKLKQQGFEIASHGATSHSSVREETARGLETFKQLIGHYPRIHCNHSMNRENLYWGAARLGTRRYRFLYRLATLGKDRRMEGHDPASPYFWGDLAQRHIQYVRNFVFREINLLKIYPKIPYRDPSKPYVNYWFTSAQAADVETFIEALAPRRQERLEAEQGVCILYTHFGAGFVRKGVLNPEFCRLMGMMAARRGWFVPVSDVLDYLRSRGGVGEIAPRDRARLERRWMIAKLLHRTPRRVRNEGEQ
jgi:hypothetical protein